MTATNRLRLALRANAAFSATGGVIALIAATDLSERLGIDHVVLTRLLGAGLVIFALDVGRASTRPEPRLLTEAALISAADIAWVVASVAVIASGVLTTTGNIVTLVVALAVADFGAAQLWFRSKARGGAHAPADTATPAAAAPAA